MKQLFKRKDDEKQLKFIQEAKTVSIRRNGSRLTIFSDSDAQLSPQEQRFEEGPSPVINISANEGDEDENPAAFGWVSFSCQ